MALRFETRSEVDTFEFGRALGAQLRPGEALLLSGDLGAGKSVLARGAARALGVEGPMPSPSFTILLSYDGRVRVHHFDLYRLSDPDEFYAAGLDEWLGGDGVCLVEWPQMADADFSPCVHATLTRVPGGEQLRSILLEPDGVSLNADALGRWRKDA